MNHSHVLFPTQSAVGGRLLYLPKPSRPRHVLSGNHLHLAPQSTVTASTLRQLGSYLATSLATFLQARQHLRYAQCAQTKHNISLTAAQRVLVALCETRRLRFLLSQPMQHQSHSLKHKAWSNPHLLCQD